MIACATGIAIGQILFKLSANAAKLADNFFSSCTGLALRSTLPLRHHNLGVGMGSSKNRLGRVYPFMALAFLVAPVLSHLVFAERISNNHLIGLGLIVVGLIFITRA